METEARKLARVAHEAYVACVKVHDRQAFAPPFDQLPDHTRSAWEQSAAAVKRALAAEAAKPAVAP